MHGSSPGAQSPQLAAAWGNLPGRHSSNCGAPGFAKPSTSHLGQLGPCPPATVLWLCGHCVYI